MDVQEDAELSGMDPFEDEQFFESYASFSLQRTMLEDKVRNSAYRSSIEKCVDEKVVLDVGCGTGFLSLLCEKYGASRTYGCEASQVAWYAFKNAECLGKTGKVFITQRKVEDLELGEEVDVIVR